jgi:VWFA-related protein
MVLAQQPQTSSQQQSTTPADLGDMGQTAPSQATTLHVAVRRVVVDVVVTDSHGKPVKGLTKDNFQVSENGKPEQMRSFEMHVSEPPPPLPKLDLPPNTFSNLSTAPQSGPVTVILYDLLNTPPDAQPFARAQLLEFLKKRSASSQMAIFVLSDKLHMLQGFTDDDNQLIAALNRQNATFYKSSDLQGPGEATQPSDSLSQTEGNQAGANAVQDVSFQAITRMLTHMETMESSAMLDQRVDITVEALEEIARFLVGLPGRKNLLWLSGSFPEGILPDASLGGRDSFEVTRNYSSTVVEATDLLNLSHVAVYPVDVRGLQVNPMYSGGNNQTYEPGLGKDVKAVHDFTQQNDAEHVTMDGIADNTGGHAFYNTNGLKEAVATAMDEGEMYYTLSYAPSDPKLDGGVRHVKVELTTPALRGAGYQMSYRRTYFADNLDSEVAQSADIPNDPLAVTLEHGGPAAHELFFEAHLQTYGAPTIATPEQMNVLAQYAAKATSKKHKAAAPDKKPEMMQRYVIEYGLLLRQLQVSLGSDGVRRADLEFAVMSYDSDGNALNGIRSQVHDAIPPDRYERLLHGDYQVAQTVAVPAQAAFLRLAVRDSNVNHMGSIEIQLPLAAVPVAAAAGGAAPAAPSTKPRTP